MKCLTNFLLILGKKNATLTEPGEIKYLSLKRETRDYPNVDIFQ